MSEVHSFCWHAVYKHGKMPRELIFPVIKEQGLIFFFNLKKLSDAFFGRQVNMASLLLKSFSKVHCFWTWHIWKCPHISSYYEAHEVNNKFIQEQRTAQYWRPQPLTKSMKSLGHHESTNPIKKLTKWFEVERKQAILVMTRAEHHSHQMLGTYRCYRFSNQNIWLTRTTSSMRLTSKTSVTRPTPTPWILRRFSAQWFYITVLFTCFF